MRKIWGPGNFVSSFLCVLLMGFRWLFSRAVARSFSVGCWIVLFCCIQAAPLQAAEKTLSFSFRPDQVQLEVLGDYCRVGLEDGASPSWPAGAPNLPCRYVNILLPAGAVLGAVRAHADDAVLAEQVLVYPFQPPRPLSDRSPVTFAAPDAAVYAGADVMPARAAEAGALQSMRGYSYVTVRLNPVRYLPAEQRLYLATNLVVTVEYDRPMQTASVSSGSVESERGRQLFEKIVRGLVVNPSDLPASESAARTMDVSVSDTVDYLIVTAPDLADSFQALADHRAVQDGLSTAVVLTTEIEQTYSGADFQQKMRACVKEYYEQHGLIYLVIGGDDTIVPDRDCYSVVAFSDGDEVESAMPTDLYFSGLDSTWDEDGDGRYGECNYSGSSDEGDLAFDVIVGRIPVRTSTQADAYIGKLVEFETNPPADHFYRRAVFLGDTLWDRYTGSSRPGDTVYDGLSGFREHTPVSDAEIWQRRKYRNHISPWWEASTEYALFTDTLTSWDTGTAGDYAQTPEHVSARLNEGWYFLDVNTHGNYSIWSLEGDSVYFSAPLASALTNLTVIVGTEACLTGGFDHSPDPCLSEAFLRNGQGGALAYMGCSRFGWGIPGSTYGGSSADYLAAFYEQVFENGICDIGQAFAASKAAMAGNCGGNDDYRWIQFGLNFQGDPAMQIHILVPQFAPVAHADSVETYSGQPTEIELQAEDDGLPDPPGALDYIITALPERGTLTDPGSGPIESVPYTLVNGGHTVLFETFYAGEDQFYFKVNDGGSAPDGGDSNDAVVELSVVGLAAGFFFDQDPGWSTDGLWGFGVPTGEGGDEFGSPDPVSGCTGTNVYGYNLNGDYECDLTIPVWLTTSAIDCSRHTNVVLSFQRWLGVEYPSYDHAFLEVSTNGNDWVRLWENPDEVIDDSWEQVSYDLSEVADLQRTVYLRWGLQTDYMSEYCGWNIDDVLLFGEYAGAEGDGDADGLPDWWERLYCGGVAEGLPGAQCSNGINTVLEAYIAGFDPADASAFFQVGGIERNVLQWQPVTGRVYSVYWSSNLLAGFPAVPFVSNLVSGVYTDSVHEAEGDGFYRIEVELAP